MPSAGGATLAAAGAAMADDAVDSLRDHTNVRRTARFDDAVAAV